jgi:hypothetical protein
MAAPSPAPAALLSWLLAGSLDIVATQGPDRFLGDGNHHAPLLMSLIETRDRLNLDAAIPESDLEDRSATNPFSRRIFSGTRMRPARSMVSSWIEM